MFLDIQTPIKTVYEGEVDSVILPGQEGFFQILNDHAPIVSALKEGTLTYQLKDGNKESVNIIGGVVEVFSNNIVVLAESIS